MKLYNVNLSPFAARVRMQIYAKGLTVEMVAPPATGLKGEEYLAINPMGKIPCLVTDDGMNLPESETIVEYLEDKFPKPALRPRKPEEKAAVRLIARVTDIYLGPALGKVFGQLNPANKSPEAAKAAVADVLLALGYVENTLSGKKHAAGTKLTTADCTLTTTLFFIDKLMPVLGVKKPFKDFPKLTKYWRSRTKDAVSAKVLEEQAIDMKARFGM